MDRLDPGVKRFVNPHVYHVSLSERLWATKRDLIRTFSPDSQMNPPGHYQLDKLCPFQVNWRILRKRLHS